jgi:hypothetical protein
MGFYVKKTEKYLKKSQDNLKKIYYAIFENEPIKCNLSNERS